MQFKINQQNQYIRTGQLGNHQVIKTPVIIPSVETLAVLTDHELTDTGTQAVYVDTLSYCLAGQNDCSNVKETLNWSGLLFANSDSQFAYSLAKPRGRKQDGVNFHSPVDQSLIHLTPAKSRQIQNRLGADYIETLSRAENYYAPVDDLVAATKQTIAWSQEQKCQQTFVPIVGGGLAKLRQMNIAAVRDYASGYSIQQMEQTGNAKETKRLLQEVVPQLMPEIPRMVKVAPYLDQVLAAISSGMDIIESDLALAMTRRQSVLTNKEHGLQLIKINRLADQSLLDQHCQCATCAAGYKVRSLRWLLQKQQPLGQRLLLIHNLQQLNRWAFKLQTALEEQRMNEFWNELQ